MFSVILVAAASGLTLTTQVTSDRVLVGEPVRVQVAVTADAGSNTFLPGDVCGGGRELAAGTLVILREGPGGQVRYRERLILGDSVTEAVRSRPGGTCTVDLTLIYGMTEGAGSGYFLPDPGDYTIRVDYRGTLSTPVHVRAEAPTGAEAEVFAALRDDPFRIQYGEDDVPQSLLSRFPRSRYLHAARLAKLDRRLDRVYRGVDPETGQLVSTDPQQVTIFIRDQSRRLADELSVEDWTTTNDVRLWLASNLARKGGDEQRADRLAEELTSRFPGSPAARRHREERDRERERAAMKAAQALARADLWEAGAEYSDGDVVRYGDALYVCTRGHVAVNGQPPSAQSSFWQRR